MLAPTRCVVLVASVLLFPLFTGWVYRDVLRTTAPGVLRQSPLPLEKSDQLLHAWILEHVYDALVHRPTRLFDANIFHPHPYSLALSDHLFGVAVTLLPVRAWTSEPLRLNLLGTLLTFVLAGLGVWALVHAITRDPVAALVAGLFYAFNPFRNHNLDQIQLLTDYAAPLAFLFLYRYQRGGRAADLVLLALAFAWQVLCSAYVGAYLAVPLALAFVWGAWRGLPRRPPRPAAHLAALGAAAAVVAPFLYPYFRLQGVLDLRQHILNSIAFSQALGDVACWRRCASATGTILTPAAALAAVGLLPGGRVPAGERTTWLLVGVASLVLALGPYVHVGAPLDPAAAPRFLAPGPYLALYRWVPGFDGLRAPIRALGCYQLALAVLAGFGAARLLRAVRGLGRVALATALVAATLLVVQHPAVRFEPIPGREAVPAVYRWLATAPGGAPVIELPMRGFGDVYTYFSAFHHRRIVNGYSGVLPLSYRYIEATTACYPCDRALAALADLGVRTHLVHLELVAAPHRAELRERIARTPSLRIVREFGDTLVIRFTPRGRSRPAPAGLTAVARESWTAASSSGPRTVDRAYDASLASAWSSAPVLDDLEHPVAGLPILRALASGRDFMALVPQGDTWFQLDLGAPASVRRLRIVFSEWTAVPLSAAPAVQGSLDGATWFPVPGDPRVWPSLRALVRRGRTATLVYDWPPTDVRFLRLQQPGYWRLHDVRLFR